MDLLGLLIFVQILGPKTHHRQISPEVNGNGVSLVYDLNGFQISSQVVGLDV